MRRAIQGLVWDRRRLWWVWVGLLTLAALGIEFLFLRVPSLPTSEGVFVAAREVELGETVSGDLFRLESRPPQEFQPHDRVSRIEWEEVRGAKLARGLSAGQVLRLSDVFSERGSKARRVPKGKRAYSISVSGGVLPSAGDWVDVVLSQKGTTGVLLNGVQVLQTLRGDPPGREWEAVLALKPSEIHRVELAQQTGKLSLALLNPSDREELLTSQGQLDLGRRGKHRSGNLQSLEIWHEE